MNIKPLFSNIDLSDLKLDREKDYSPILLKIPTSDGSGQTVHPDVLFFENGYNGWRYWMCVTPYPNTSASDENPEIFVSDDGIEWEVPNGVTNPIAPKPTNGHNSDPDLVYIEDTGELWLFYREVLTIGGDREENIILMKSTDGTDWGTQTTVLSATSPSGEQQKLLSPTVIKDDGVYKMFYVDFWTDGKGVIYKTESNDGETWSLGDEITLIGESDMGKASTGQTLSPWHIDVIKTDNRLEFVVQSARDRFGRNGRQHFAFSEDGGETITIREPFIPELRYYFESDRQYQGTLRKVKSFPGLYELWLSAMSVDDTWSSVYLPMRLNENDQLELIDESLLFGLLNKKTTDKNIIDL